MQSSVVVVYKVWVGTKLSLNNMQVASVDYLSLTCAHEMQCRVRAHIAHRRSITDDIVRICEVTVDSKQR